MPLLQATRDNVVASLALELNRRVTLRHPVHLGVPRVVESCSARGFVHRVRSWLAGRLQNRDWVESAFLEHLALIGPRLLLNFEAVIPVLRVQNLLSGLCKVVPQQCSLLVLVSAAHVASLVHSRCGSSEKGAVVLVHLVLYLWLSAVEMSNISSEVRVGSQTSVDTEIGTCLDTTLTTVLNGADLVHVNSINVVECFVSNSELRSVRG